MWLASASAGATWQAVLVRFSEFWSLVDEVFGPAYGRTLVETQVLTVLDSRTAAAALEDGETDPRDVWRALCDAMDVPESKRHGSDDPRRSRRAG
jgi:hypothetical protein